jgi:hypothetical protein
MSMLARRGSIGVGLRGCGAELSCRGGVCGAAGLGGGFGKCAYAGLVGLAEGGCVNVEHSGFHYLVRGRACNFAES